MDEKRLRESIQRRLVRLQGSRSGRRFARDVGIHQQNMALYLAGQATPSLISAMRISSAERCSLDWLCNGVGTR